MLNFLGIKYRSIIIWFSFTIKSAFIPYIYWHLLKTATQKFVVKINKWMKNSWIMNPSLMMMIESLLKKTLCEKFTRYLPLELNWGERSKETAVCWRADFTIEPHPLSISLTKWMQALWSNFERIAKACFPLNMNQLGKLQ